MESKMVIEKQGFYIKKTDESAITPSQGSEEAAGYDLCALKETVIPPKGKGLVSTGIEMAIPFGAYGRIAPRSGLAWKNFIDVGAGVIDSDYRGEVKVLLFNFGEEEFKVSKGDRVAQIIIEKVVPTMIKEVPELPSSKRGEGGFGSTGIKSSNQNEKRIPSTLTREEATLDMVDSAHKDMISTHLELKLLKKELVALKIIRLREINEITAEEKEALVKCLQEENGLSAVYNLLEGTELNPRPDLKEKIEHYIKLKQ